MIRRLVTALLPLALIGLSACSPVDPLVGTWQQTGVVGGDDVEQSVPESDAVVLELRRGGKATVIFPQGDEKGAPYTWDAADGTLKLADNPNGDLRTMFELDYELDDDRLEMDWISEPTPRIFERQ